jgi:FixJ family two-component response regulator
MGSNDHIDWELHTAISQALDENRIEEGSAAAGIAQQVIHQGYESLSPAQKAVYDRVVLPALGKQAQQNEINEKINSWPK